MQDVQMTHDAHTENYNHNTEEANRTNLSELLLDLFLPQVVRHGQDLHRFPRLASVRVARQGADAAHDVTENSRADDHDDGRVGPLQVRDRQDVPVPEDDDAIVFPDVCLKVAKKVSVLLF